MDACAVGLEHTSSRAGAVQNLFADTASGNFQTNNFSKGGAGNANFSTPADGQKPRMQMYLWTGAGATQEVLANGTAWAAMSADGCEANLTSLSGKVALVQRGTCAFTINAVTGADVHDDGEIYAAAGYSNDTLMDLFVDGMNYTPAFPFLRY